jgi:hypothetical protein
MIGEQNKGAQLACKIKRGGVFTQSAWAPIQDALNALLGWFWPVSVENGGIDVEYTAQGARLKISDSVLDAINAGGASEPTTTSDDSGDDDNEYEVTLTVDDVFSPVLNETYEYDLDGNTTAYHVWATCRKGAVYTYTGVSISATFETVEITASGSFWLSVTLDATTGLPASVATSFGDQPSGDVVFEVATVVYDAAAKSCHASRVLTRNPACAKIGSNINVW